MGLLVKAHKLIWQHGPLVKMYQFKATVSVNPCGHVFTKSLLLSFSILDAHQLSSSNMN